MKRAVLAWLFVVAIGVGYLATLPGGEWRAARFSTHEPAPERATQQRAMQQGREQADGVLPAALYQTHSIARHGGGPVYASEIEAALQHGKAPLEAEAASKRLRAQIEIWRKAGARAVE